MKASSKTLLLAAAVMLWGCTPHPGSGNWKAVDSAPQGIDRIVVKFEGRAEFFTAGAEKAQWRCFWGGKDDQSLALDCIFAADTAITSDFTLQAIGDDRAKLYKLGEFVAEFVR